MIVWKQNGGSAETNKETMETADEGKRQQSGECLIYVKAF